MLKLRHIFIAIWLYLVCAMKKILNASFLLILLTLMSCGSGVNPLLLRVPEGAISPANESPSVYAAALLRAENSQATGSDEIDEIHNEFVKNMAELDKLKATFGVSSEVNALSSKMLDVKQKEASTNRADHIKILDDLFEIMQPGKQGFLLLNKLRMVSGAQSGTARTFADILERLINSRIYAELLHSRHDVLQKVSAAAKTALTPARQAVSQCKLNSDAKKNADRVHELLNILSFGYEYQELTAQSAGLYVDAILEIKEIVAGYAGIQANELVGARANFDNAWKSVQSGFNGLAHEILILSLFEKTLHYLKPDTNPYLSKILEPLPFGERPALAKETLKSSLLKQEMLQGKDALAFSVSDEMELKIIGDYLKLRGEDVYHVNLSIITAYARKAELISKKMIEYTAKTVINKKAEESKSKSKPIFLLHDLGSLAYDERITDPDSKAHDLADNFDELISQVEDALVIAPVRDKNEELLAESSIADDIYVNFPPLSLQHAEKVIIAFLQENASRNPRLKLDQRSLMSMARAARGLDPKNFSLGRLFKMIKLYVNEVSKTKNHRIVAKDEKDLALGVVEKTLKIARTTINESQVLNFSHFHIEKLLKEDPDYFINPLNIKRMQERTLRMHAMMSKAEDSNTQSRRITLVEKELKANAKKFGEDITATNKKLEDRTEMLNKIFTKVSLANSESARLMTHLSRFSMEQAEDDLNRWGRTKKARLKQAIKQANVVQDYLDNDKPVSTYPYSFIKYLYVTKKKWFNVKTLEAPRGTPAHHTKEYWKRLAPTLGWPAAEVDKL